MFFTKYSIRFYDEEERKQKVVTGITCGETLQENVERIIAYYGDEVITELNIHEIGDTDSGVMEDGC